MKADQTVSRKPFDYGVGALVVLVMSAGAAAIVYSLVLPLNLLDIPIWIFGPLGIYTLAYSFISGKDSTYYLVWGTASVAIAIIFRFYNFISPFVILGVLAIVIAIMGIVAYQRSRK